MPVKAVNYQYRGGQTRIDFAGTVLLPQAKGDAIVESKAGRTEIDAKFSRVGTPGRFGEVLADSGDRADCQTGLADHFLDRLPHPGDARLGPLFDLRGNAGPAQRPAQIIDHADFDVRAPHIHADEKRRFCVGERNELPETY